MPKLLFFALVTTGGVLVAVQASLNNRLRQALEGDALMAALLSFIVGTLTLLVIVLIRGGGLTSLRNLHGTLESVPWWAFAGGLCGAFYVLAIILGVPQIGVALCMAAVLIGQQLCAISLDHFGAFGLEPVAISAQRLLGLACLLLGAWLLRPA